MRDTLIKWLDWPQSWAALALGGICVLTLLPPLVGFGGFGPGLALAGFGLGVGLMVAAVVRMRRAATTVNPRGVPAALVTDSVFAISRNPIYLGDALILLAAVFWADQVLALPVVAAFIWVINNRFIPVEEQRLAEAFGDQATEYFLRVRRWI